MHGSRRLSERVSMLLYAGHIPGLWVTTKSATCTEAGQRARTCQDCDAVLAEEEIPALGHCFGEWGTVDGKRVRVCECGKQTSGCASLLSVGSVAIMLLATGAGTLLLKRKKD